MNIGDVIEIPVTVSRDDGPGGSRRIIQEWTIIDDYKNFVLCQRGQERQCFTRNELIQLGYECQSARYEALRYERNQHWSAGKSTDNYKRKYETDNNGY